VGAIDFPGVWDTKIRLCTQKVSLISTLDRPLNPSFTLGMIRICVGAWGVMSLKASTCQKGENNRAINIYSKLISEVWATKISLIPNWERLKYRLERWNIFEMS